MKNESRRLVVPIDFWMSGFLSLFLGIHGCEHRDKVTAIESRSEGSSETIGDADVLAQAELFLHLLRGPDTKDGYADPKRPPEVGNYSDRKIRFVFFNDPFGPITIQLDENAKRGNYLFLNGAVVRRDVDQKVDVGFPPLYSLEEMEKLLQLPHNRWAVD